MIHPSACIHPSARLDPSCEIGPFAVIDADVVLGPGCVVGPHAHLTGRTVVGSNNRFHSGCVIGDAPQDLKYKGEPTGLRIGDDNVFREHVTVHRSNTPNEDTVIGSRNFLMANSHVGHNSHLGSFVILANGALLGGHVTVEDRAFISGNCLVHQFVRIGTLALMQGGAAVSKDVPPFTISHSDNRLCGLNVIGLRRAGVSAEDRLALKRVYHAVFRQKGNVRQVAEKARAGAPPLVLALLDFVLESKRGVCAHSRAARLAPE